MKVLCLDVSSRSTGYCVLNKGKLLKSQCGRIEIKGKKLLGEKLIEFEKELKKLIKKMKPDLLVVEDIFCRNVLTFKTLCLFHSIVYQLSWEIFKLDPVYIKATQARKFLSARDKKDTFKKIVSKFELENFDFKKHNDITDSIAIGVAYFEKEKEKPKSVR